MQHLLDWSLDSLTQWLVDHGEPAYRARQIWNWVFQRGAASFDVMANLPRSLRQALAEEFALRRTQIAASRQAADGTQKLLLQLADAERVECVLLRDDQGHRTACISTQVGCGMRCVFCASGLEGVVRNLSKSEVLEQLLQLHSLLPDGERLSHIVVMGMGEPLANLEAVLGALAVASADTGLGISARRITISTVGIPAGIRRLADNDVPYHLAISLHAPDDALRDSLIPANRGTGIAAILEAADYYFDKTGRRVTYEYVLLGGRNDRPEHAARLASLLQSRNAMVNLIPFNPVEGLNFRAPKPEDAQRFAEVLRGRGVNVQTRWRKGDRIDAACGQLRRQAGVTDA